MKQHQEEVKKKQNKKNQQKGQNRKGLTNQEQKSPKPKEIQCMLKHHQLTFETQPFLTQNTNVRN